METDTVLKSILHRIDGRGYKAYMDIKGQYDFREYALIVDHVQGDPFALPSSVRVKVTQKKAGFSLDTYHNRSREVALCDYLARKFFHAIGRFCHGRRGTGKSGAIIIEHPGQEILERTSVIVSKDEVEVRFRMGLPAFGRRIAGRHAESMFFEELPRIVKHSLIFMNLDRKKLYEHIAIAEDADYLRGILPELGLVGFIADGAILPRASGIDSRPLTRGKVVPFQSADSLSVQVSLPNRGKITGMGIPKGVTLIIGGGYHGKSTLLRALELGIYNHIPADGRELVVSDPYTVKIRAEDGRRIEKVDISPFISNLPFGKDTKAFSTEDASGSTSQAANIIEALEVGTKVLIMDEDTSATNFMIRDHRMQELVSKDKEPITPFIDKIRQLHSDVGVSSVLAIGGSGDYFDVADHIICLIEYKPYDYTDKARAIADKYRAERKPEGGENFGEIIERIPLAKSIDPRKGKREVKISSKGIRTIDFGIHKIDLSSVEQLVDVCQTRAIGDAVQYATKYMDGKRTLNQIVRLVMEDKERNGLAIFSNRPTGDYAVFRDFELAAAINRLRTVSVTKKLR